MHELILHQYAISPFSEKIRLAMGLKDLAWRAVEIPAVMPKPDVVPLTGGYRKTPVLQIGADVYCDTALIAREIERRHPRPTLYPGDTEGLAHALSYWSDRAMFLTAVGLVFGEIGDSVPAEFLKDRARMRGAAFDIAEMRGQRAVFLDQLRAHLAKVDAQLARDRPFLLGDRPGLVDLGAYHVLWFLRNAPAASALVTSRPRIAAWMERVEALGHGRPTPLDSGEAIAIARAAEPETPPAVDDDPSGRQAGDRVTVAADDYGRDPVVGELVVATAEEVAVRRSDERVGTVVVHFPRDGFTVTPA